MSTQKETWDHLPQISYHGDVYEINDSLQVGPSIRKLFGSHFDVDVRSGHIVGFDAEWRPYEKNASRNPIALIQIYAPGRCVVLYHISTIMKRGQPFPETLARLLENPGIYKTGLGIRSDAIRLYQDYGIRMRGVNDIINLPIYRSCKPKGMAAMVARFMGRYVDKTQATSDWEGDPLSPDQIRYAATDAYISYELYLAMVNHY